MNNRIPVAVLGATGSVGQRFIQLLDGHPWFEVVALTGSERKTGQTYSEACHWVLPEPMPAWARSLEVLASDPDEVPARIVFSALPAGKAREIEPHFAQAGAGVFSNASAFRTEPDVPILVPEVNAGHANLVEAQRQRRGWRGCIVTNPNCTSTGLTVTFKALQDAFGVRRAFAVSLQALSGAGYPGVASLDILDNAIPYIAGEEDKVEEEPRKMLGELHGDEIRPAPFTLSVHTNRVAVSDGHLVCASVELERPAGLEAAAAALSAYRAPEVARDLPSAPRPVICSRTARPFNRPDRMEDVATPRGRLRPTRSSA
jgi:aspartate-semialdehyde dehydrogenase